VKQSFISNKTFSVRNDSSDEEEDWSDMFIDNT
jgi:hypothetical protein